MTVEELINVSYLRMIFRDKVDKSIIYDFDWSNVEKESIFLDKYEDRKIISICGVCDSVVDVYI